MRGRAASSVFANPVLVGAVTVLIVIVAVFLSYNANNGLPFVPTTTLKVRFANGAEPGQGQRDPLRRLPHRRRRGHEAGQAHAPARPAPSSSSSSTRRSARSPRTRAGASARARRSASSTSSSARAARRRPSRTATRSRSSRPTPTSTSTRSSRSSTPRRARASQQNLRGFGDSFAGRGAAVGRTVEEAPRLFQHLEPVAANLADPQHRAAALLQGARRRGAHRRADLEDQRAPVHDDGRHLGGRRARPRGAAPDDRQAARRRWTRRSSRSRSSARSSPS